MADEFEPGDIVYAGYPTAHVHTIGRNSRTKKLTLTRAKHLLWGDWVSVTEYDFVAEGDGAHLKPPLDPAEHGEVGALVAGMVPVRVRGVSGYMYPEDLQPERLLEVVFVDVGQGDGALLVTPDDKKYVIDAGEGENMYRYLRWRFRNFEHAHTDFDGLIITHPDMDHYEGFRRLFEDGAVQASHIWHNGLVEQFGVSSDGDQLTSKDLLLGKRKNWPEQPMHPHSLPWTLIGTGILWFGWAGFNAGSALAADGVAAQALYNTFVAASAGMLGWLLVEKIKDGHATTLGAASGAVAGLVAITPCAGFVGGLSPMIIGAVTGAICFLAISLKYRFGYDDSLDVVGVHLVGGLLGSVLLGFFATTEVNAAGKDGLFFGGGSTLLIEQVIAAVVVLVFSFVVSIVIAKVIDVAFGGLRVTEEDEELGLDLSQHAETAYNS